jgi:SAM-dependent methyltransferase
MKVASAPDDRSFWIGWQESWDRQQERFLPDREERFSVLLELIGALAGAGAPRVLDLACGCGSITARVLRRFPSAQVVAADLDPVLLRIAKGVFEGDDRVTLAEIDLRRPDWTGSLPPGEYQAVVSATALHWLQPGTLATVYADLAELVGRGGLVANADHMPLREAPGLELAAAALSLPSGGGGEDWEEWWARVARTRAFDELLAERSRRFSGELHPSQPAQPAEWHLAQLAAAGFSESAVVWRRGPDAVVAALR